MDVADDRLADEFLQIADSNSNNNIVEIDTDNNALSDSEADNQTPLTTKEINELLKRAPFKKIELTVQMSTLTREELEKITKSKRGNDHCKKKRPQQCCVVL